MNDKIIDIIEEILKFPKYDLTEYQISEIKTLINLKLKEYFSNDTVSFAGTHFCFNEDEEKIIELSIREMISDRLLSVSDDVIDSHYKIYGELGVKERYDYVNRLFEILEKLEESNKIRNKKTGEEEC